MKNEGYENLNRYIETQDREQEGNYRRTVINEPTHRNTLTGNRALMRRAKFKTQSEYPIEEMI